MLPKPGKIAKSIIKINFKIKWKVSQARINKYTSQVVQNLPGNAGDTGDMGSIPESGRYPGVRKSNPFQYSSLENSNDRAATGCYRIPGMLQDCRVGRD